MRTARSTYGVLAILTMATAMAQTPYPDLTIQNVTWTEGTHHYSGSQSIISPSAESLPVSIEGTADAEFVSGTQVHLLPGFHAGGLAGAGRFHAYIDNGLGAAGDVVVISPNASGNDPYGSIEDNVVHVHKWEKVEVGLRLPQEYLTAIDNFFRHYYPYSYPPFPPNWSNANLAFPGSVVAAHDLNPYADDSLQLVMTLTKPDGSQTMKWGFYMKEGKWISQTADAGLEAADPTTNVHVPYNVRFRFAPDQEGEWQFSLSIKAPHTSTSTNTPLPDVSYSGYRLICDPPLPDNNGHLQVNEANRRNLQFQGDASFEGDETAFFGVGVNMADVRTGEWNPGPPHHGGRIFRRDFETMKTTMTQLHDVGGNFMRMYSMRNIFAPEWVNLGVYDAFKTPEVCDDQNFPACNNGGLQTDLAGNCQFQSWAFDQMLDHAHANNIYLQLCIDPYPPVVGYENFIWGAHPYVIHFLEPEREFPPDPNPWDIKRFFYSYDPNGPDPDDPQAVRLYDEGVFYYWKRKYKYIMSRWGYSVNLPIIEPFNEIDQLFTFDTVNMVPDPNEPDPCEFNTSTCVENRVNWIEDPLLRSTISDWFSDIADYVRGELDWEHPELSPLGEESKLFLASYAGGSPNDADAATYYSPFLNPDVDLNDAHKGLHNSWDLQGFSANFEEYRNTFTANGVKKPFNSGEFTHYFKKMLGTKEYDLSPYFHNYEIAFHNEVWAGAFSGRFATGTSWAWNRVFWWEDSLEPAPDDGNNPFDSGGSDQFDNRPNEWNRLRVNNGDYWVQNRSVYHNFKPLTDLLNHPSWAPYDFFSNDYMVRQWTTETSDLEAYYLQNGSDTELSTVAIGWVRNRNSSIFNSYYLTSAEQQFFSCDPPNATSDGFYLTGFVPGEYHVSWFPTRWNSNVHPPDAEVSTLFSSSLLYLDMEDQFGGIDNDYLDTLRGDYAFIITPGPFAKSRRPDAVDVDVSLEWDFMVYPNPSREGFTLRFEDDAPKEVTILDLSGRLMAQKASVTATSLQFPELRLAQGAYWVRVKDGVHHGTRKLIIQ